MRPCGFRCRSLPTSWPDTARLGVLGSSASLTSWPACAEIGNSRDARRWALLLERLDADRDLTGEPIEPAIQAIGRILARLHGAPVPREIPPLAAMATRWAHDLPRLWSAAEPPWPDRVCSEAVATCRELGNDSLIRLLHADLHFENVLAADREPWLAIDPKGLAGDPAFESWSVLWNRFEEYARPRDVGRRLDMWCEAAQIDRDRARAWARARTVTDAIDRLVHATDHERDISVHRYLLAAIPH
jgi:streptomycin 6-kinase